MLQSGGRPPLISPRGLHLTKPTSGKAIKMPIYFYNPFPAAISQLFWCLMSDIIVRCHQSLIFPVPKLFSRLSWFLLKRFHFIICRRQLPANWLSVSSQCPVDHEVIIRCLSTELWFNWLQSFANQKSCDTLLLLGALVQFVPSKTWISWSLIRAHPVNV